MVQVSIIIPTFNNLELLQGCIGSIKNQSFKDYEVFVIDAESTDGTVEFLQTLKEPFHFISEADQGVYDAMNKGISLSRGKWVYFMGSDDRLYENQTLRLLFDSKFDEEISLIIGKIQYDCSVNNSKLLKKKQIWFSPWSLNLWIRNAPHHQAIFYKRSIFEHLKYDLKYPILSDYDLNLKLYKRNLKVKIVEQTIALCGGEGISKKFDWQLYREEIELKTNLSFFLLKPFFYILGFGKYILKKVS
ncbi:MAG: glycosyltransferase family 2 protein [Aquaticitalea sp.]